MRKLYSESPNSRPIPPSFYLDTNVIGYWLDGKIPDFVPELKKRGLIPVASDTTLFELSARSDSKLIAEVLLREGFYSIQSNEPLYLDGTFWVYKFNASIGEGEFDSRHYSIIFDLLRAASGDTTIDMLNSSFLGSLEAVIDEFDKDISEAEDDRIRQSFVVAKARLISGIDDIMNAAKTMEPSSVVFSRRELEKGKIGPKHFSYLRPPKLVKKIIEKVDESVRAGLEEYFVPFEVTDNIRERIQLACLMLTYLGFCRDKKIGKADQKVSLRGAASQFRDFEHISAAAGLSFLFTGDKDCARIAYAIYEHFGIRTEVVFVNQQKTAPMFTLVDEKNWP